ncbi:MAG: hypothetical protein ACYDA3_06170 [Gaiellaceae bacterium]
METRLVECLNCGATRRISAAPSRPSAPTDCPRCGYVGWAEAASLTETLRRALRERPVESRRVHIATW